MLLVRGMQFGNPDVIQFRRDMLAEQRARGIIIGDYRAAVRANMRGKLWVCIMSNFALVLPTKL